MYISILFQILLVAIPAKISKMEKNKHCLSEIKLDNYFYKQMVSAFKDLKKMTKLCAQMRYRIGHKYNHFPSVTWPNCNIFSIG